MFVTLNMKIHFKLKNGLERSMNGLNLYSQREMGTLDAK